MKRRIVSLFMALALCLSLLPTAALATEVEPVEQPPVEQPAEVVPAPEGGEEEPAEVPAEEPEEVPEEPVESVSEVLTAAAESANAGTEAEHNSHCVCGAVHQASGTHTTEQSETWVGVDTLNDITDAGHYYLTQDVTLDAKWEPVDGVVLCLNGKTVTGPHGYFAISVNKGVTFTMTDCEPKGEAGKVTHAENQTGGGVWVCADGIFNMYGGSICDNNTGNSGAGVYTAGAFYMYGGSITGNKDTDRGGGVFVEENASFTMSGGSITDNKAGGYGGGVFVNGSITVSGDAKITGNTDSNAAGSTPRTCNVYIGSDDTIIIGADGLKEGAEIGVRTTLDLNRTDQAPNGRVVIVSNATKDDAKYFVSDVDTYYRVYDEGNILLSQTEIHKHPICGDESCTILDHQYKEEWTGVSNLHNNMNAGKYYLTEDVTLTDSWKPKNGTVLCLNGHTITQEAYDYVITVGDGVKFTLTDCEPKGEAGKVTHASGITGTGVYVQSNSEFTMYGGSITGHKDSDTNRSVLGSVRVEGKFYMRGGSITDNDIAYGGGVYVKGGTFYMYDNALISNNKATAPKGSSGTDYGGGGVYVESGKFTMYGGSITGNKAESTSWSISGGGVFVKGGTFTMQGGTIHGNEVWSYGWNAYGGGVFVGNGAVFNMTGGSITGNYAFASSGGSNGGGVGVDNGGTFTMYNGSITGNNATAGSGNSGGVYTNGTFKVYGATITGNYVGGELNKETGLYEKGSGWDCNVYLLKDKMINASALGTSGEIGVTTAVKPTDTTAVTIATGVESKNYKCFVSDEGYYPVYDADSKEIRLEKNEPHTHYLCGGDTCTKVGHDEETNMATFKAWSEKTSLPSGAGYYYLTENVELSETWKINGDAGRKVVLCLNGHTIKMQNSGAVINVGNDRSLTLTDCSEGETGKVTHEAGKAGGGVTVTTGGTFTLYGGSITGNETGTGQGGGGVYVYGTFNMSGGSISGNNANGNGGGVFVDEGTFELENGSITGNNAGDGGGVYVDTNGTFTMSGGSITGNQTSYSGGGGVYVRGTFKLEGGSSITGNYAGGTLNEKSGLYEKGENGKDNNVFLPSGKTIDASRLDATGGTIGVTTAVKPTGGNPVTIANAQYQNQLSRFVSDEGYYPVYDADSKEIRLEKNEPHTHYLCGGGTCTEVGHAQENDKTKFKAWSEKTSLPSEDGNYYLTEDVELSSTWTLQSPVKNIVLCLNGHTIKTTGNTDVITVMNGGRSLTLTDCAPEGKVGTVTHEAGKTGRGVTVSIGSTFTLYGGSITGNQTANRYGGGGVYVSAGTFNMCGGSITGNKTANRYGGGGVYVSAGTFNMCGGSVSGNEAGSNGGGVYVDIGTFNMYGGGSISGNNANGNGGGVYVNISKTGATSTFTMSGGSISGNNATGYSGGGVCVKDGTFKLQNGSITRNYADGTLNTESGVYEKGENGKGSNVYLYSGKTIDVSGLEATGGTIGVTTQTVPTDGKPVAIATGATDGVDYGEIFTPDVKDKDYTITRENDKVYLTAHTHDWAYSVSSDGKTISAKCSSCGESGGSVTIKEPAERTYSGEEKECWRYLDERDVKIPSTTITYQAWNGQAWEACETPVNAGKYKGILTAADGETSAKVEFEIGKATPSYSAPTGLTAVYGQTLADVTLPAGWSWKNAADSVGDATADSSALFAAVFTPDDTNNYNTVEEEVAVKVKKAAGENLGTITLTQRYNDKGVHTQALVWTKLPSGQTWSFNCDVNREIATKDIADNGSTLTYQVTDGTVGETITFSVWARCKNYEDFTYTVELLITDRTPQSGFGFASDAKTVTYGDEDFTLAATGNAAGSSVTYTSSDPAVATVDGSGKVRIVGAGTATITAAASATDEYAAATASYTLTVQKKALTITGVTVASKTYDGTKDATITGVTFDGLKDGDTLALGTDYTVSGAFNSANVKDANKVTATVALKAKNYTLGENTFAVNASIGKADPVYSAPAVSTVYGVGKTLADVTLPAGWSWMDTAKSVGDASTTAKTFKARYTHGDTDNYNVVENIDAQLTVNKAPARTLADITNQQKYTVTGEQSEALGSIMPADAGTLTYTSGLPTVSGTATVTGFAVDSNGVVKYTINGSAGAVITLPVTISSTNYADSTVKVVVTLTAKDDQAALELSGGDSVVYGETLTFSATGGSGSGKVTYSVVNGTGEATIDADTGVLTTVKAGTVKVKAVKAGDANFNEVTSNEIEVTIQQAACTGESRFDKITSGNKTLADVGLTIVDGEGNDIPGTLEWLDAEGNVLPNDTVVERNKSYKWRFTPADGNYAELTGDVEPYHVSPSGGRSTPTVDVTKLPLLRTGSTGEYVKYLQERLNTLGYSCGDVDGIFGKRTHAAVTEFQRNNGLSVDGIVGPLTWGKLGVEYLPAPSGSTGSAVDAALPLLRTGSTGEYVKRLQRRLNELGYSCGDVDGIFGSKTYAAVTAFQKATGLSIDGVVGPLTWTKLG